MNISSNMGPLAQSKESSAVKTIYTEKLTRDETLELRAKIEENSSAFAFSSTDVQLSVKSVADGFAQKYEDFQSFLKDVGYDGKPIGKLSQDEAAALVSEDGIFGVKQTSERIANFVIQGAGGDEATLRAGREGMLRGFKEAERTWGGELPEISQKTMRAATEMVDKAMRDLGFSILNQEV